MNVWGQVGLVRECAEAPAGATAERVLAALPQQAQRSTHILKSGYATVRAQWVPHSARPPSTPAPVRSPASVHAKSQRPHTPEITTGPPRPDADAQEPCPSLQPLRRPPPPARRPHSSRRAAPRRPRPIPPRACAAAPASAAQAGAGGCAGACLAEGVCAVPAGRRASCPAEGRAPAGGAAAARISFRPVEPRAAPEGARCFHMAAAPWTAAAVASPAGAGPGPAAPAALCARSAQRAHNAGGAAREAHLWRLERARRHRARWRPMAGRSACGGRRASARRRDARGGGGGRGAVRGGCGRRRVFPRDSAVVKRGWRTLSRRVRLVRGEGRGVSD